MPKSKRTLGPLITERFSPYANYFVHIGNILALIATNQSEMISLRVFMISVTTCMISFNLLQYPKPLVVPALWGTVFIISHGYQIFLLLQEKR
mmetsp:Transcript_7039/g.17188  ORF Transcript_7039/g.17188 Transcript_7039/m.17188 type:complete len:93 (+) Transcript_7039:265-543(+)